MNKRTGPSAWQEAEAPSLHSGREAAARGRFEKSGETAAVFGPRANVGGAQLYTWRRQIKDGTLEATASPTAAPKEKPGATRLFSADERRQAVEAFVKSGMSAKAFAQLYGTSDQTLYGWVTRFKEGGPQALEDKRSGRKKGTGGGQEVVVDPDKGEAEITFHGIPRLQGSKRTDGSAGKEERTPRPLSVRPLVSRWRGHALYASGSFGNRGSSTTAVAALRSESEDLALSGKREPGLGRPCAGRIMTP
jgi:transposase-like protein